MKITKQTPIAVIGVSTNQSKYGFKIFRDLVANQYDVVGVNPKGGVVLQQKIYQSLEEIPKKPELLIIVVPPKIGINVVKEAEKLGITQFWLQPGAESDEIVNYCKDNNLTVVYNSCYMVEHNIW